MSFDEVAFGPDPLATFAVWREEAAGAMALPDAVALATSTKDGRPSVRYVLLRGIDAHGVRFFTNYESRKGAELDANPRAAIAWWAWPTDRQVRLEGTVRRLDAAASDAYFESRARGHQLGAHASHQSAPVRDRAELEAAYDEAARRFEGAAVPRPPGWGGFQLDCDAVELWVQRDDRLHDRIRYERAGAQWTSVRLAP